MKRFRVVEGVYVWRGYIEEGDGKGMGMGRRRVRMQSEVLLSRLSQRLNYPSFVLRITIFLRCALTITLGPPLAR